MHSERKQSFIVGVTGGIGSGKTVVTDFLSQQGIIIIDADVASRTIVQPNQPALKDIETRYGSTILLNNGSLDRRQLRRIIFNDQDEKMWLENLLHPKINELIGQQLSEAKSPYVVLVSPLLIEIEQHKMVDRILVVDISEALQLERSMLRDSMTQQQAQSIINSQVCREKRLKLADDVIDNNGTLIDLYESLIKLHQRYLLLSDQHV